MGGRWRLRNHADHHSFVAMIMKAPQGLQAAEKDAYEMGFNLRRK